MPDDLGTKGPTDKKWVDVNESREVSWWASALLTTEEKLKTAVKTVGTRVKDIRKHLAK